MENGELGGGCEKGELDEYPWFDWLDEGMFLVNGFVLVGWLLIGVVIPEPKEEVVDVPVIIMDCLNGFIDGTEELSVAPVAKAC